VAGDLHRRPPGLSCTTVLVNRLTILRNKAIDEVRKRLPLPLVPSEQLDRLEYGEESSSRLEGIDVSTVVWKAIESLPPQQKKIVSAWLALDCPSETEAIRRALEATGETMSAEAIRSNLYEARLKLKRMLKAWDADVEQHSSASTESQ
jgi:DNA-directed RNA polymerase specialized sigma24 family protein